MKVSTNALLIQQDQVYSGLLLENTSQHSLIFKIKITDTNLFTIAPAKGLLNPRDQMKIQIKINQNIHFQAKLLISSAKTPNYSMQAFEEQWKQLHKNNIQNCVIQIKRNTFAAVQNRSREDSRGITIKRTQSPILQPLTQSQMLAKTSSNYVSKNFTNLSQENIQSSKSIEEINPLSFNSIKNSKKLLNITRQISKQREIKEKMMQKLIQAQKKVRYYQQLKQIEINSTMNSRDDESGPYLLNIGLGVFICLILGFFIAKIDLVTQ